MNEILMLHLWRKGSHAILRTIAGRGHAIRHSIGDDGIVSNDIPIWDPVLPLEPVAVMREGRLQVVEDGPILRGRAGSDGSVTGIGDAVPSPMGLLLLLLKGLDAIVEPRGFGSGVVRLIRGWGKEGKRGTFGKSV